MPPPLVGLTSPAASPTAITRGPYDFWTGSSGIPQRRASCAGPQTLPLKHFVLVEDFAAHDAVRLELAYSPDIADPEGRGTISARVKLLRADGSMRKLGKLTAVQNRVSGDDLGWQHES